MKVSDYICRNLKKLTGSKDVFLLSGGGMMHLLDSLGKSNLNPVSMHHEQAASIAAYANGRSKNSIGICFATSGPGATNAITGTAAAFTDSVPMIFISGQVSTSTSQNKLGFRQLGFQEFNIIESIKSCTKYAKYISKKNDIKYELEKAIYLSKSGRPGPVWLDIPIDIQASYINLKKIRSFSPKKENLLNTNPAPTNEFINSIISKINKSKRPLIIFGHGVFLANAKKDARTLVKKFMIPVQTTWNSIDLIPDNYPMYFGRANSYGPRYANFIIQNADYVLSIGARLGIQHTGYNVKEFCRDAFLDMVDLDPIEAKKPNLNVSRFTKCDAGKLLKNLIVKLDKRKKIKKDDYKKWINYCKNIKKKYPISASLNKISNQKFVDPYYFINTLSEICRRNELIALGGSGTCFTVAGQAFKAKENQRVFHAKGMAAMGFGIPSSIGVAVAHKGRRVLTIVGDGGFQLNMQELQTISQRNLPIKIFVIQNDGYHAIRVTQDTYFNKKYIGSSKEFGVSIPSFKKIANTYNFKYTVIKKNKSLSNLIKKILKNNNREIIEIVVDPKKHLYPKLASKINSDGSMYTPSLEDLFPFLDRDEFNSNMILKK